MSDHSYTIYEPEDPSQNLVTRADELVFIKDGFSFWAMFGSVFWMIYHRLWMPLVGFLAALGILIGLALLLGAAPDTNGLLFAGLSVALGFLGNDIRRMELERTQHNMIGTIAGQSQIECERRFLSSWSPLTDLLADQADHLQKEANL